MTSIGSDPLVVENFPPERPSLRVALVTETYPPEVNGVALTIDQLVRGLCARQHDIQLIRPRQARHEVPGSVQGLEQVLTRGMPIPRYPQLRLGMPAKRALQAMWATRRPDIVHIATEGPLGWSALRLAHKLRLPVTTDFRTNFHAYSRHYGVGWLKKPIVAYLRRFHNQADCTMVPTPGLKLELEAMGFERVRVVARGVDTQRFDPARRSEALRAAWGVGSGDPVVLSVGRLAPEKNLDLLVQAHDAMRRVNPAVRLVVVGDGPEREALQQRCPQALLVGEKRSDDLAIHYASADVFLFPSLTETFGNVTLEAMASGLAVVAFDYAAAAEVVAHGDNGLRVPFGDADAFTRRAADLGANAELRQRLRQGARSAMVGRDWGGITRQVEAIWMTLCAREGHRAAPRGEIGDALGELPGA
jgi:glycosyltransferase involved in cell wall biosynthesis